MLESSTDLFDFDFDVECENLDPSFSIMPSFETSVSQSIANGFVPSPTSEITANNGSFEEFVEFPSLTENALATFLQLPRNSNFVDGCHLVDQNSIPCSEREAKLVEDLVKAKCALKSPANKKHNKEVYKSQLAKFVCKFQFNCSEVEFVKKAKSIKNVILRVLTDHHRSQEKTDRNVQNKHAKYRNPDDYKNVVKLCREKNNMFNTFKDLKFSTSTVSSSDTAMSVSTVSSDAWTKETTFGGAGTGGETGGQDGLDVLLSIMDEEEGMIVL